MSSSSLHAPYQPSVTITLDVVVSDPPLIDPEIYDCWLKGFSIEQTTTHLAQRRRNIVQNAQTTLQSWFHVETVSQYRLFNMLKPLFTHPKLFMNTSSKTMLVQFPPIVRRSLINRYYQFDEEVFREILGKKLSPKVRKDLDDVSEKTQVDLTSCRRQFDNLHEVFNKTLKVINHQMHHYQKSTPSLNHNSLTSLIQKEFFLEEQLAKKYSVAIFVCHYRFEIFKRRTRELTFDDIYIMTSSMMQYWTNSVSPNPLRFTLDPSLLREVKSILISDREKRFEEYRELVKQKLLQVISSVGTTKELTPAVAAKIDEKFMILMKNILYIAANLQQAKELRDFFLDLQEKFVDIWIQKVKASAAVCEVFWEKAIECCSEIPGVSENLMLIHHFTQYLCALRDCTSAMLDARAKANKYN